MAWVAIGKKPIKREKMMKKALVLLSGGLDSATCLAIAKAEGFDCYALSFDYHQRHRVELESAQAVALHLGVGNHRIFKLDIGQFGGSALTDQAMDIPQYSGGSEIPVTYVPARNTVFLSIALAYAETIGAQAIFIGISAIDYSNYPDCRPEFISAFETMANLATKAGVEGRHIQIHAPLIHLTKAQTLLMGMRLGVDYGLTISCYQADAKGRSCGHCDSCYLRKKGFIEAGLSDPTRYVQ